MSSARTLLKSTLGLKTAPTLWEGRACDGQTARVGRGPPWEQSRERRGECRRPAGSPRRPEWCREVPRGAERCRVTPSGAEWCRVIPSGAEWCRATRQRLASTAPPTARPGGHPNGTCPAGIAHVPLRCLQMLHFLPETLQTLLPAAHSFLSHVDACYGCAFLA